MTPPDTPPRPRGRLIDTRRAAELLACHPATIRRWAKEGAITEYRVGALIRYDETEVLALARLGA